MRGFTLLELMLALTIAGILSGIAMPSYQSAVHRTRRVDARLALLHVQYLQERHYALYHRYAASLAGTAAAAGLNTATSSPTGDYALALRVGLDGQSYSTTAHATSAGRQVRDHDCQWLSVDHSGRRRAANAAGIWTESDPNRCWG